MTETLFRYAACNKLSIVPIPAGQKAPTGIVANVFADCSADPVEWIRWRSQNPGCNWSLVAGPSRIVVVDIDTNKQGRDEAWAAWANWCISNGLPVYPPQVQTRSGGWHCLFQVPPDIDARTLRQPDLAPGINVRAGNGYVVCPPSVVDGVAYQWLNFEPPHPAPAALIQHCSPPQLPSVQSPPIQADYDPADVASMLAFMTERGEFESYETWIKCGMSLKSSMGDPAFPLWELTFDDTVEPSAAQVKWESFAEDRAGGVTINSLMKRAHELDWKGKLRRSADAMFSAAVAEAALPAPKRDGYTSLIGGPRPQPAAPEYSEGEIARRFANDYHKQFRYVRSRGQWTIWTGKRWAIDERGFVEDMARQHCSSEAALCAGSPGQTYANARSINTARTVRAVLTLAQSDPRIASISSDWDQDAWLLGTPDKVVDLRTNTVRDATPDDQITKSTAVSPGGACPTWLAFIDRATNGNAELKEYLQRTAGYYLTGSTQEHSLHFMYGPGGTGKGTFMSAVAGILHDYHVTTAIETLTESKSDRHPAELAALQGARLVTCSETERGRHWAESRIKQLTGGDAISARFMNQNWFNYTPTFKLLISGNYKPHLRPDSAMRRRFQLIPFETVIAYEDRDPRLGEKLRQEWPGILGWMIAGARMWQRDGLRPPSAVTAATETYMSEESEDVVSHWIAERCLQESGAESPHSTLYQSYRSYAEQAGERPMTSAQLGKELVRLGFGKARSARGRFVTGLALDNPMPPAPPVPQLPRLPR